MTESNKKKTRRRFLADMLFLGGGISAAALLARSRFAPDERPGPQAAGEMQAPTNVEKTPCEYPPTAGEPMPPEMEGDVVAPQHVEQPPGVKGEVALPPQVEGRVVRPPTAGKPMAPRPELGR